MKNTQTQNRAEVTNNPSITNKYDLIKLSIDWHVRQYKVVRIIDNAGPEPSQSFSPEKFLDWAERQKQLAHQVICCYEAGPGGFVLYRQLVAKGIPTYVVAPRNLDKDHTGVRNDERDARELAQDLDRYVRGNAKALRLVYVPTAEQEQRRCQSRLRQSLRQDRLALATRGRMRLLSQGFRETNRWWAERRWAVLKNQLPAWLVELLEVERRLILAVHDELEQLTKKVTQGASDQRPLGMGKLTLEEIKREVCDFKRFKHRKAPGSYAGLVGGVSTSGDQHCDLPITKAGNMRLRTMSIELAWRMVRFQPQCPLIQRWRHVLLNPYAHKRARKRAIVAVARQLLVDLWRWQTGRITPAQLGWMMVELRTLDLANSLQEQQSQ